MTAKMWCRLCSAAHPASLGFCPVHRSDLEEIPDVDTPVMDVDDAGPLPRSVCWNCRHRSPNPRNHQCIECKESLVPPSLVLRFRDGQVVLRRNESAELGRLGPYGYLFEPFLHVSRHHAVASVDAQGQARIEPVPAAPNGTFVNGEEIFNPRALDSGCEVRFASAATGTVGSVARPEFE